MVARIVDESEMTAELDAEIRALLCLSFGARAAATFSKTRAWNGSAPAFTSVIKEPAEAGKLHVVAHLGVVDRIVAVGALSVRVAGVQNVAVHPDQRGRRLTDSTMAAAMDEAQRRGFEAGLLFCIPRMAPFYARLGWILLQDREVTRLHEGTQCGLETGNVAMVLPLKLAAFPAGKVHLNGDDW